MPARNLFNRLKEKNILLEYCSWMMDMLRVVIRRRIKKKVGGKIFLSNQKLIKLISLLSTLCKVKILFCKLQIPKSRAG